MNIIFCGNIEENFIVVVDDEEFEFEMLRKVLNRKIRIFKVVEKIFILDNGRKKFLRVKGRGKNKKVIEEYLECEKFDVNFE